MLSKGHGPQHDGAELLKSTPGFCMLPWTHLHVRTDGKVAPCCDFDGELGDIRDHDFRTILDGPPIREIRLKMLRGETVPGCWRCADRERSDALSIRQTKNRELGRHIDSVLTTQSDGHAPDARAVYWDVRFSNVCNFRCRSCWHGASSRWFEDAVTLGRELGDQAVIRADEDSSRLFCELDSLLPEVEEIYFAGGEPMLMDQHYQLLQILAKRNRTDVQLRYSSNLSSLTYKGIDVLDLWHHFPKVQLMASVDAMGSRGELVRKELNWERFTANLQAVKHRCPHVERLTLTTVSIFNVLHLPELQRFLHLECDIPIGRILLHMLQVPHFYSIRILPISLKRLAVEQLNDHLVWLGERSWADPAGVAVQQRQINAVIQEMDAASTTTSLDEFREECAKIDALRQESVEQTFPELALLFATSS